MNDVDNWVGSTLPTTRNLFLDRSMVVSGFSSSKESDRKLDLILGRIGLDVGSQFLPIMVVGLRPSIYIKLLG